MKDSRGARQHHPLSIMWNQEAFAAVHFKKIHKLNSDSDGSIPVSLELLTCADVLFFALFLFLLLLLFLAGIQAITISN